MLIFSYLHVYWLVSKSKTWNWIDMMTYFNIFGSQQYYKLIGASRWKHKVVYEEEELRSKYKEVISYKTANVYYSFLVHTRCFQAVLLSKEKRTFQHVSSKISLTYSFKQLKQFPTPELIDNSPVNCFQGLSENVKSLFLCVSKPHTGEGGGRLPYREPTRTGVFGRLCSQNVFCKQKILKQGTNKIHRFQECFRRGQVSSNGFKVFNGCIVHPWIFLVRLQKKN